MFTLHFYHWNQLSRSPGLYSPYMESTHVQKNRLRRPYYTTSITALPSRMLNDSDLKGHSGAD